MMPILNSRPAVHRLLTVVGLLAVAAGSLPALAAAQEILPEPTVPAAPGSLSAAQRNLELAELRLLRFDRIDFPLAQKRLENKIEMVKLEIDSLKRRIDEYERFTKNAYSSPLIYTLEEYRLALADAELRQETLLRERCLRVQYRGAMRRIRELEVEQSRDWVEQFSQ